MSDEAIKREAAEKALNFLFSPPLVFTRERITPEAAIFAFKALIKVDQGSRASYGLFKLWSPVPATSWKGIATKFAKAVIGALKDPDQYKKSLIGLAYIVQPHRRNLQLHLRDPDTFPCPEFKD